MIIEYHVIFSFLGIIILLAFIYFILVTFKRSRENYSFKKNDNLFTEAERSFLKVLDQVAGDQFRIFGKVRVADALSVTSASNRQEWWRAFNKINAKHFDYVVCDADSYFIRAAVELDDKSHNKANRQIRDDFLTRACQVAGLPLIRISAQKEYSLHEIKSKLSGALHIENRQEDIHADEMKPEPDTEDRNTDLPQCPKCSSTMVRRAVKSGPRAGQEFWGCVRFPQCRGVRKV